MTTMQRQREEEKRQLQLEMRRREQELLNKIKEQQKALENMKLEKIKVRWTAIVLSLIFCGPIPASFSSFQTNITIFTKKCMWKNVHPVYSARIWTHDLQGMSLLP